VANSLVGKVRKGGGGDLLADSQYGLRSLSQDRQYAVAANIFFRFYLVSL